jgi:hypothetical protein
VGAGPLSSAGGAPDLDESGRLSHIVTDALVPQTPEEGRLLRNAPQTRGHDPSPRRGTPLPLAAFLPQASLRKSRLGTVPAAPATAAVMAGTFRKTLSPELEHTVSTTISHLPQTGVVGFGA